LHWCPTGRFTRLPLHAAGIYHGPSSFHICCADYVVSSYTPTLTILLRAQRSLSSMLRDTLNMAIVAEKQAQDSHLEIIHQVDAELSNVFAVARSSGIKAVHPVSNPTTVSRTSNVMQAANIVHLACHGIQDTADATNSGFCLGDGRLTISNLMELRLNNAFLAFLSACETAKGDTKQPDQVMHLAAAMLFSGFKTVIATMWYV
jgi:CHAT domain-containing protein